MLGNPWHCKEEIFEEISLGLIIEGITDFNNFTKQLQNQPKNQINIFQLTNTSSFLLFNSNFQELQRLKNDFDYSHYQAYSIFLNDSYFDKFINFFKQKNIMMPNFKEELYYLFFESNNYSSQFQILKNCSDYKFFTKSPPRYFCGFTTFSDLLKSYTNLIKEGENWPIFALPNKFIEKVNKFNLKTKESNIAINQNKFTKFTQFIPDKKLFYLSFIEKDLKKPQRIQNSEEMYSIKEINDLQISSIYKDQIRTFLGFRSLFRCLHVFDYFFQLEKKSNSITDVILIENSNLSKFNAIRYNLFYIEIQNQSSSFDCSLLFSINYVDVVNLNNSSFYGFDNQIDFQSALKILSDSIKIVINDVRFVDHSEFTTKFEKKIADKMSRTQFLYIVLSTLNNNLNGLQTILKPAKIIEKNVSYRIDNKNVDYVLVGFKNMDDRAKAFLALSNLKKSSEIRVFYPEGQGVSSTRKKLRKKQIKKEKEKIEIDNNITDIDDKNEEEYEADDEYDENKEDDKINIKNEEENEIDYNENKKDYMVDDKNDDENEVDDDYDDNSEEFYQAQIQTKIKQQMNNQYNENLNDTQKYSQKSSQQKNLGPDFFSPNQNLIYLYFIEKEKARKIMQGKQVKLTLFGVKKCKDIQRYKKLNEEESGYFTFFGFDSYDDANAAVNDIKSKWLSETPIKIYEQTAAFIQHQKEPNSIYNDDEKLFIQAINDKKNQQKSQNQSKIKIDEKVATKITDVKINSYKSLDLTHPFCFFFNQITTPINFQLELKTTLLKTKSVTSIVKDVIINSISYDPFTYIFVDSYQQLNQMAFMNVLTHNKIGLSALEYDNEYAFQYLEFCEKNIPENIIDNFIKFLSHCEKIDKIERNVFHCGTFVTIIYSDDQNVLGLIKNYLSQQKCLFDWKKYSVKKSIYFNEEVILKRKEDFDLIVNEIESFGIKPINIERNKLLFLDAPHENQFLRNLSFICFNSISDKLKALNHINSILYRDKDNVMKFNPSLYYLKIDPLKIKNNKYDPFPALSKIVNDMTDVGDFQMNVYSIESPVELTYIGFKSQEYFLFYNMTTFMRLHHLCFFPTAKFFNPKKNLFYIQVQTVLDIDLLTKIESGIAERIKDYQIECTNLRKKMFRRIFIGFENEDERKFMYFKLSHLYSNPNEFNVSLLEINMESANFPETNELYSENLLDVTNNNK